MVKFLRIILLALFTAGLLGACSTLRLGYGQAPELAYWWLDGYADFDDVQEPLVRDAVGDWFRWHRSTQLPDYVDLLQRARADILQPTTPERVCEWSARLDDRLAAAADQALPRAAAIALALGPAQFKAIERKQAETMEELREEFLEGTPEERLERSLERTEERLNRVYGRLDKAQRDRLAAALAASPFDPQVWLAERQARQEDLLATVRRLQQDKATPEQARQALAGLLSRVDRSPREVYRRYAERLREYNCGLGAMVHNMMLPAQREAAAKRFDGWAQDLRSLTTADAR